MDTWTETILSHRKAGWTYQRIADSMNTTRCAVAGVVYRSGATKEAIKAGKRFPSSIRRQVVSMYRRGWKQGAIAVSLGISQSTVSAYCRGLGVDK